jgi:hypothetical protein
MLMALRLGSECLLCARCVHGYKQSLSVHVAAGHCRHHLAGLTGIVSSDSERLFWVLQCAPACIDH